MKTNRFVRILAAVVCVILVASVCPVATAGSAYRYRDSYHGSGDGQLLIRYAPTLGFNVVVGVWIDGRYAGNFAWGHTFRRTLPAGPHVITVVPNGRMSGASDTVVDVRPGAATAYFAQYRVSHLALQPAIDFRDWQY